MPKAISYIRFSTGKQARGSSHERQKQAVDRWVIANPDYIPSDLSFADIGKSGYHGDHIKLGGGWAKLLIAVEAGHIQSGDVVLVEAMDRTGRLPPLDMIDIIKPVLKAGVAIITLDDGNRFDEESLNGPQIYLLVAKIQAAHGYSKTLSERVTASYESRRTKARNGEGVKRLAVAWLTTDGELKQHLVHHIKEVFDLYISGVGKHTIANRLRASGVAEFATCSGPTVDMWLKSKSAIGYWNDIPNVYTPVVTPEVFMLAQQRQKEMKTTRQSYTSKNFLVGMIKCGTCGANYILHRKDSRPHNMRCITHHRLKDAGCVNKETIPYQVIHFMYLSTAPAWIDRALKVIQLTDNAKRKLTLTTERDEVTASIKRLAKLLAKAKSDSPELEAEYDLLNERRTSIDSELEILARKADDGVDSKSTSTFIGYEATVEHDRLAFNDPVQLTALLKQAGYSITVQPGRKLYLANSDTPWVYTGVVRKGNMTLGYRIQDDEWEHTISNVIPEAVDVQAYENKPDGELAHTMERSYKHVKSPRPLNQAGKRNTKGMTIEKVDVTV
ncbi:recombinase family protein [Pseudomonas nunensis]|uniref:Recombinase family protein n=1 Tax=Pseudomonas nunensis TaxID=2961896 RepID=A0ABY5EFZ8_9PSED|nr:recombinase family protein [Pseudomonas nunensis]MCL5224572.1 recombinase family protein [Pseudomonas nunensis]UTO14186.1 recombinase family protein [Pseudomonas nunensis]